MGSNKVMRVGPSWIILVPLSRDPLRDLYSLPPCGYATQKRALTPQYSQILTVLATMISDLQLPEQLEISVVYKPPGLRDPVTVPSWN